MLTPANSATATRDARAMPRWLRDKLVEWYFGPEADPAKAAADITVFYAYADGRTVWLVLASAGATLDLHRFFADLSRDGIAHSLDSQWRTTDG